jgi:hypothetical protein
MRVLVYVGVLFAFTISELFPHKMQFLKPMFELLALYIPPPVGDRFPEKEQLISVGLLPLLHIPPPKRA